MPVSQQRFAEAARQGAREQFAQNIGRSGLPTAQELAERLVQNGVTTTERRLPEAKSASVAPVDEFGANPQNAVQGEIEGVDRNTGNSKIGEMSNSRLTQDQLAEYLDVGSRQHIRHGKQDIVESGESPILYTDDEIKAFIGDSISGNKKDVIKAYGKVGGRLSSDTYNISTQKLQRPVDITGYYLELDSNYLQHINDEHGADLEESQIPLTENQIKNLPNYIDQYDDILDVRRYRDGAVRVILGKKINGHAVIVETVSSGRKSLQPRTAYQLETSKYNQKWIYAPKAKSDNRTKTNGAATSTYIISDSLAKSQDAVKNPDPPSPKLPTVQETQRTLSFIEQARRYNLPAQETANISKLASKTGAQVILDPGVDAEGSYFNGIIRLNPKSITAERTAQLVFLHELTHQTEGTTAYFDFQAAALESQAFKNYLAENGADLATFKRQISDTYAAKGTSLDEAGVNAEMTARFAEKLLNDQAAIDRLAQTDRSLFARIRNWIRDMIAQFRGTPQERELAKLRQMYDKALNPGVHSAEQAHSVELNAQNRPFVIIDEDILDGVPQSKWVDTVKDELSRRYPEGISLNPLAGTVVVNSRTKKEYTNSKYTNQLKSSDQQRYMDKMRLVSNLDEIIRNAYNVGNETPKHERSDNIKSFNRGQIEIRVGGNEYTAEVVTGVLPSTKEIVYDIVGINPTKIETPQSGELPKQTPQVGEVSASYYAQDSEKVNNKFSHAMNPAEIANDSDVDKLSPVAPKAEQKQGDSTSELGISVENSPIFSTPFKNRVMKNANIQTYDRITNKQALDEAAAALDNGRGEHVTRWALNFGKSAASAQDIATAILLMDAYQQAGDLDSATAVMEKLREAGTRSGQAIQAFSLLQRLTPQGMIYYAQKSLTQTKEQLMRGKTDAWIKAHESDFTLTPEEVEFIRLRTVQASQLPAGRDKNIRLAEIASLIQDKIPPEKGQRLKALQRMSMLLNPKTNIRNFAGNAIIAPMHLASDAIGTVMDKALASKTGVRTTGLSMKGMGKAAFRGGFESIDDFWRNINTREMDSGRYDLELRGGKTNSKDLEYTARSAFGGGSSGSQFDILTSHGRSFSTKNPIGRSLNFLDRLTGSLLELGDRPFFEAWFTKSINNQMRLNNVSSPTAEMIDIATQEALQRTWQDTNYMTEMTKLVKKAGNMMSIRGYGLGDYLIKFVKTPANIAKAIIDFSPVGLVTNVIGDINAFNLAKGGDGTGLATAQRNLVRDLSNAITGSIAMLGFYFLAQAGFISGGGDDDKDAANFQQNVQGVMPYSFKIGNGSASYEWMQPVGGLAAAAANFANSPKDASLVNKVLNAINALGDVYMQQTFMESVKALFSGDNVIEGIISNVPNEFAILVPQVVSQLAQTTDDTARQTFVYGNMLETAKNKVIAKLPYARNTLPARKDVLGRDIESKTNLANVFLNPANNVSAKPTTESNEMWRVYQATGDAAVIPPTAPYYITIDGEKTILTNEERNQYQTVVGDIATSGVAGLLNSSDYKRLPDTDKAEAIKDVYGYATAKAKASVSDYTLPTQYQKVDSLAEQGVKPSQYYTVKMKLDTFKGEGATDKKRQALMDYSGLTPAQKSAIDTALIGEKKEKVDYSDKESYITSQMSEAKQYKCGVASDLGMSLDSFTKYYDAFYSGSNSKKDVGIQNCINAGMTKGQAETFYKKVIAVKASGGEATDNKKRAALNAGLSETNWNRLWPLYAEYGTKEEKIQRLVNGGMRQGQAEFFYKLMQDN